MKSMMTAAARLPAPSKYCNRWQEPFSKSRPLQGDFFCVRVSVCKCLKSRTSRRVIVTPLVAFVISGRFLFTSRKNFAKNPKTDIGSAARQIRYMVLPAGK